MEPAEFDKFAEEYRQSHKSVIRASGEDPDFFYQYKIDDLAGVAGKLHLSGNISVLDFGCGVGNSLPHLHDRFPDSKIIGIDVSQRSIDISNERFGDIARCSHFDGNVIPCNDSVFDIAFTACVFHHIPADRHIPLFREIRRTLKPGGLFMIFEHNPYNPLTVQAVRSCVFDENAVLIKAGMLRNRLVRAGFENPKLTYRIFFPRSLVTFRGMEPLLGWLPLGAQYSLAATK